MGTLMGIQNSQGYAEAQRNIIEGCSRGGKMGDKSKKAAGGLGLVGRTNLNTRKVNGMMLIAITPSVLKKLLTVKGS